MSFEDKCDDFQDICTSPTKNKSFKCTPISKLTQNVENSKKFPKIKENFIDKLKTECENNVKNILNPPMNSTLKSLEQSLNEAIYHSSRNRPLGRTPRTIRIPLEPCTTEEEIVVDSRSIKSGSIKSINTPLTNRTITLEKTPKREDDLRETPSTKLKVNKEKLSSKHSKIFDENQTFGIKNSIDHRRMKDIMKDPHEPLNQTFRKIIQVEQTERTKPSVGRPRKLKTIKEPLPYNFIFGEKSSRDKYGARELLHQQNPNPKRDEILNSVGHMHSIRRILKNKYDFSILFLYDDLLNADVEKTGYLPWNDIFNIIRFQNEVPLRKNKSETLIDYFKLRNNDGRVNYMEFVNLINDLIPFPALGKLDSQSKCPCDFPTTYQDQTRNLLKVKIATPEISKAGVKVSKNAHNLDLSDDLGDETKVKELISPAVSSWFGLNHRDYLLPRSKEEIHKIFINSGFDLSDESHFNSLFEKAAKLSNSKDGKISVEAFKQIVKKENKNF